MFPCWVFFLYLFIYKKMQLVNIGKNLPPSIHNDLTHDSLNLRRGRISFHHTAVDAAARDWGSIKRLAPAAVLYPESVDDIVSLVRTTTAARLSSSSSNLTLAAKGRGHSVNGQAQALDGIVIEMSTLALGIQVMPEGDADCPVAFVDAAGGELWIDVLKATLKHGLAPRSWTDYLYLSVGGTLSNAGVSGQTFRHGPQISNVLQLEVVTGKGELVICSPSKQPDLFFAVLGGLGQFGIITRARILLERAPQQVRWIRAMYTDFQSFTRDQEMLISTQKKAAVEDAAGTFDYVEGIVIINNDNPYNGWKSVPFAPQELNSSSMIPKDAGSLLYYIELAKGFDHNNIHAMEQEVEKMLAPLNYIPSLIFTADVSYFQFLNRVHDAELSLSSQGLWETLSHPWINLLVPSSAISDFDEQVFQQLICQDFSGPILVYPLNKHKWDKRASAVFPDEDVFYLVALLRNALPSAGPGVSLRSQIDDNSKILSICHHLGCKQYLPTYNTPEQWEQHFGSDGWENFVRRKQTFDPHAILAPSQNIFQRDDQILAQLRAPMR
ncbi:unnamed protein product [Sphagnum jensenii]|uniref:cytokinin dehydrogenase n=1 Tax=Sphagnum jensenii TaxID=128206 RepID=A0ABP1AF03_9BRYO